MPEYILHTKHHGKFEDVAITKTLVFICLKYKSDTEK